MLETQEDHRVSVAYGDNTIDFTLGYHPSWVGRTIYEPEVVNITNRFLRKGDIAIDAGANIGFFTLLFSRIVGETGLVMAFEPDAYCLRELKRNLAANQADNVAASSQALWSENGYKEFHVVGYGGGYSSFIHYVNIESDSRIVATRTLDDIFLGKYEFPNPRVIKLDCEGAEEQILIGAEHLLTRGDGVDCIVMEFNMPIMSAMQSSERSIRKLMKMFGYDFFLINIGDPQTGTYSKPIRVPFETDICVQGRGRVMNVMFSRQDKVDTLWK